MTDRGDYLRTQLQETGRISVFRLRLSELAEAAVDLGIDPAKVEIGGGYAVVVNKTREESSRG